MKNLVVIFLFCFSLNVLVEEEDLRENNETDQLFDQELKEEDFEIPAFLRRQKF